MKIVSILAVFALACGGAHISAQMHDDPSHASTSASGLVTMSQWSQRVQSLLQKQLHYPASLMSGRRNSGIVRVKFNCSEAGRPDQVTLVKSSGAFELDRAAMRAVSRIVSLHPLPDGLKSGQRFEAAIVFADTIDDPQLKLIAAEQTKRNQWYRDSAMTAQATPILLVAN